MNILNAGEQTIYKFQQRISALPLALFRWLFGILLLVEIYRYYVNGWISEYFIEPEFLFYFPGFHWLDAWSGNGMYYHFLVLALASLFFTIGFLYRISATIVFFGFTYIFLLSKTNYLNHFYLTCLLAFLFVLIPAHRRLSVDRLREDVTDTTVPYWTLFIVRFQIGIVYLFGGIAKLNGDWLQGQPGGLWMQKHPEVVALFNNYISPETAALTASYGGLLLDLLAVPLLLWRKTRLPTIAFLLVFHLFNGLFLPIGIFPWMAAGLTLLFLPPEWFDSAFITLSGYENRSSSIPSSNTINWNWSKLLIAMILGLFCLVQILLPLRHFILPGNPTWTGYGHRFAWRMKLNSMKTDVLYQVRASDGSWRSWTPGQANLLTPRQVYRLGRYPDQVIQYAHRIGRYMRQKKSNHDPKIRVNYRTSLNGRPWQNRIDPTINLLDVNPNWYKFSILVPIKHPLPGNHKLLSNLNDQVRSYLFGSGRD